MGLATKGVAMTVSYGQEMCTRCHKTVVPMRLESEKFVSTYCPLCGACISDVLKPATTDREKGTS